MSDLLTVRQVQEILQVDRTTIYRMLKDGRLSGVKIGNQWRFHRSQIDSLFEDESPKTNTDALSLEILPLTCLQGMQNISAEAIGVSAVIVNAVGAPLTAPSFPSRFCQLVKSSEAGRTACQADLALAASRAGSPIPQFTCHAGLQCVGAPITINGVETAVFIANQFATAPLDDQRKQQIQQIADAYGLNPDELIEAAAETAVLDQAQQKKVTAWLPKLAHTLSEIGQERADLLGRLQRIAHMSNLGTESTARLSAVGN